MPQVLPGQRLRIAARDWNRVQAAADAIEAQRGGQQPGRGVGTILVRNTSDRDLAEFAVMCVSGVLVTPEANLAEFQFRWALDVDVPSADTLGQLVITQEPIKAGAVGRAVACGISPVQLLGELTGDTAGAVADKTTYLDAGGRGAQVLWAEDYVAPGEGETEEPRWALVRLPFDGETAVVGGIYRGFAGSPWLGHNSGGDVTYLNVSFDEADLSGCTKIALISNCAAWDTLYDPCSFDLVFSGETIPLIKAAYVEAIGRWGHPYFGTITNYAATLPTAERRASVASFAFKLIDDYSSPPYYPQVEMWLTGFCAW